MKKKILSTVIALAMILSQGIIFAEEATDEVTLSYTDTAESKYNTAIKTLTKYGIVSGDEGKFNPQDNLTRAQVAKMLLIANRFNDEAVKEFPVCEDYADLPTDHWGNKYVSAAAQFKYIKGFNDNTMHPDDNVTYAQLLAMLIRLTGYESCAELGGGFPDGYYAISQTLDMTRNVKIEDLNTDITREEAAQIIYRAMQVPLMGVSGFNVVDNVMYPVMIVMDGTDDTNRKTLLSELQKQAEKAQ